MKKTLHPALAALFWIGVWQVIAMIVAKPYILASPVETAGVLCRLAVTGAFWRNVMTSVLGIMLGFFAACAVGLLLSACAVRFTAVKTLLEPLMTVIRSVPVASFIILILIWIGTRGLSFVISFLMAMPVLYTNMLTGLSSVGSEQRDLMRVFCVGKTKRVLYFYLPSAWRDLTAGCRVALGLCWKAGVAAEIIGLCADCIGEQLYYARLYFDTASLFAYTFVIVAFSFLFEKTILLLLGRLGKAVGYAGT